MEQTILKYPQALEPEWVLECSSCGERFPLGPMMSGCPVCREQNRHGVLEAVFRPRENPRALGNRVGHGGLSRFTHLLPRCGDHEWISLGEGGTPLLRSRIIGPRLGLRALYFKNETVNPTWSFKDRYAAVTINAGVGLGFRNFVVSSTGNLGVSVAAYAAAARARCILVAPASISPSLVAQARSHGAQIAIVEESARRRLFEVISGHKTWFPVGLFLPRAFQNPFGIEGYKTIAYETIEELGAAPAAILFPCARGNGLYGAWKGFREAVDWKWASRVPAMVACQPSGANSLQISLERGFDQCVELPRVTSVAVSTSETVASDHALHAIRQSGGSAFSASDGDILEAVSQLGREGLFVEASSALPIACLPQLVAQGKIDPDKPVVCVLTAAGVKWFGNSHTANGNPVEGTGDTEAIDRLLQELGVI